MEQNKVSNDDVNVFRKSSGAVLVSAEVQRHSARHLPRPSCSAAAALPKKIFWLVTAVGTEKNHVPSVVLVSSGEVDGGI